MIRVFFRKFIAVKESMYDFCTMKVRTKYAFTYKKSTYIICEKSKKHVLVDFLND